MNSHLLMAGGWSFLAFGFVLLLGFSWHAKGIFSPPITKVEEEKDRMGGGGARTEIY